LGACFLIPTRFGSASGSNVHAGEDPLPPKESAVHLPWLRLATYLANRGARKAHSSLSYPSFFLRSSRAKSILLAFPPFWHASWHQLHNRFFTRDEGIS